MTGILSQPVKGAAQFTFFFPFPAQNRLVTDKLSMNGKLVGNDTFFILEKRSYMPGTGNISVQFFGPEKLRERHSFPPLLHTGNGCTAPWEKMPGI